MAWRWLEGLLGTNKSRSRRNDVKRYLRIEELESRRLLTIVSIGGVIDVSNFPGATGDVPVRGIHVHAWIDGNNFYNPNPTKNPAAGLNRRLIVEELEQRRSARKNFSEKRILGNNFAGIARMEVGSVVRLAGIEAMAQAV